MRKSLIAAGWMLATSVALADPGGHEIIYSGANGLGTHAPGMWRALGYQRIFNNGLYVGGEGGAGYVLPGRTSAYATLRAGFRAGSLSEDWVVRPQVGVAVSSPFIMSYDLGGGNYVTAGLAGRLAGHIAWATEYEYGRVSQTEVGLPAAKGSVRLLRLSLGVAF